MPIRAAFFDLDGVVCDTEPQYSIFWGEICRRYHPELPGLENRIKGQTLVQIFDAHFPDAQQQREIVAELDEYERNMRYDYIAGFPEFLHLMREKGLKTALVTSSNLVKIAVVFQAHPEFHSLFDTILTSEDFTESKPSPQCYLKAAEHFGLQPEECVVFEDSFNGLRSGKSAGMYVVGLSTTNTPDAIASFCDEVIPDFTVSPQVVLGT